MATFTLLYLNGITLNLMTLGGLALGVECWWITPLLYWKISTVSDLKGMT
ncbi:hypothetical protein [Alkaliphilus metalliredigens]